FLRYYREMAAVRFGLMAMAQVHGAAPVAQAFAEASKPHLVKR
ncbi:MAG: staphylolytic protease PREPROENZYME LASA, partial [Rhodobacteraceae bacterium]|nr:staphylolytic protease PREPROENZYME LASA [Paracoccaceae bacterium]